MADVLFAGVASGIPLLLVGGDGAAEDEPSERADSEALEPPTICESDIRYEL